MFIIPATPWHAYCRQNNDNHYIYKLHNGARGLTVAEKFLFPVSDQAVIAQRPREVHLCFDLDTHSYFSSVFPGHVYKHSIQMFCVMTDVLKACSWISPDKITAVKKLWFFHNFILTNVLVLSKKKYLKRVLLFITSFLLLLFSKSSLKEIAVCVHYLYIVRIW